MFEVLFTPNELYTDDYLKKLIKIYLENLNIPGFEDAKEWDLDQELYVLFQTMRSMGLVTLISIGMAMDQEKQLKEDKVQTIQMGVDIYEYWMKRVREFREKLAQKAA